MLIDLVNGEGVQLAGAADGRGVAVRQQWGPSGFSETWASRFSPESGWSTAERLNHVEGTRNPRPAINDSGTIVVVWEGSGKGETSGLWETIWATRYAPGAGWSGPVRLETRSVFPGDPLESVVELAVAPNGEAIAVWQQSDWEDGIWASRYLPSTGWSSPARLDLTGGTFFARPKVATDGAGNAVAVWWQEDRDWKNVWARRFTKGFGWEQPTLLELADGEAGLPRIALNREGDGLAVWWQCAEPTGGGACVWARPLAGQRAGN
jgi:hypothetical protein